MSDQNLLTAVNQGQVPARTKTDFQATGAGVMVRTVDEAITLAKAFAASGMFKDIKGANEAVAKILMGAEFGITPVAAMNGIHFVNGKLQLSGVLIATLIKRSKSYDYRVRESTQKVAEIEFFENGESIGVERFTEEDAKRQGTQNIQKFAKNMLWNRAMSNGAKFYTPDVFGGQPVYVEGEIEEEPDAPQLPAGASRADEIKARLKPAEEAPIEATFEEQPIEEPTDDGADLPQ